MIDKNGRCPSTTAEADTIPAAAQPDSRRELPQMIRSLANEAELKALLHDAPALLLYFSAPGCGVCHALKPKVSALLAEEFPRMAFAEVDCTASPALCAQQQIFTVPSLLLFLEGHESQRWVRNVHLNELRDLLARPYALLFGGES